MVKGKAKPVQAWAVGEVIGSRTRDASVQLPLIGRDKELARAPRGALADASGGRGLAGRDRRRAGDRQDAADRGASRGAGGACPAGDGRGVHVLDARTSSGVRSCASLLGVGWEADDETVHPAAPGRSMIEREPALVPWLPLIAIPLDVDVPMTPEVEQLGRGVPQPKLHEVVGRFLEAHDDGPTLLHVEDAHLMDGSSADLFRLSARVRSASARGSARRPGVRRHAGSSPPEHERARSITLEPLRETTSSSWSRRRPRTCRCFRTTSRSSPTARAVTRSSRWTLRRSSHRAGCCRSRSRPRRWRGSTRLPPPTESSSAARRSWATPFALALPRRCAG